MITQLGEEGFRWFFGIVEDIKDPLKLGRVKVRIINEHDDNVKTDDLTWSHVMLPTTSGSFHGVGDTPNLLVGSTIIGFFIDSNEKQLAMILGTFPIIPGMDNDKHSLSALAREKQIVEKEKIGPEPESPYAAEYPYNRVISTRSGHIIELDDTPEHERVHIFHKSGTYIEIDEKGKLVIKAVDDSYDLVANNKQIFVEGNIDIHSSKQINIIGKDSVTITSNTDVNIAAKGKVSISGGQGVNIKSGKDIALKSPGGVGVPLSGITAMGAVSSAVGVTGSFTTPSGKVVHVNNGLVTNIT